MAQAEDDLRKISLASFDHVRVPVDYSVLEDEDGNRKPLYCGEYGVIDLAEREDTLLWYKDIRTAFEKDGIHRHTTIYPVNQLPFFNGFSFLFCIPTINQQEYPLLYSLRKYLCFIR